MSAEINNFRDLIAWQKAMLLAKAVYRATSCMPDAERYGLTAQVRRSVVSIPSNIAEGYGRESLMDYIRFLRTARGSLFEVQTQLELAGDLGMINIPVSLKEILSEIDRVLQGLIRSLKRKADAD